MKTVCNLLSLGKTRPDNLFHTSGHVQCHFFDCSSFRHWDLPKHLTNLFTFSAFNLFYLWPLCWLLPCKAPLEKEQSHRCSGMGSCFQETKPSPKHDPTDPKTSIYSDDEHIEALAAYHLHQIFTQTTTVYRTGIQQFLLKKT